MMTDKKQTRKPNSITVIGKKWFDRANGNTYFSSVIHVNGEWVVTLPYQYGYGEQYLWEAFSWLTDNGFLAMSGGPPSYVCRENGINLIAEEVDCKKRELAEEMEKSDKLKFAEEYGIPCGDVFHLCQLADKIKSAQEHECNGDKFNSGAEETDTSKKSRNAELWGAFVDACWEEMVATSEPYGFEVVSSGLRPGLRNAGVWVDLP